MRAFFFVSSNGTLPATAVMPKTSISSGLAKARKIATASSWPGSVSIIIFFGDINVAPIQTEYCHCEDVFSRKMIVGKIIFVGKKSEVNQPVLK
jgi:hypothetical protein